ncbi:Ku protein [Streptomyces sp. NBC_00687]|uniref:non-homologous end joining protein Ku n=1 Tax=Streptomyces sp. NBC_00687 TaxID=2975807 RepID=UPI0022536E9D|nr:Ku protein [Streptomyces sp. NBC_00687]MCX4917016.1 Ku protein [Streptomyces sp. NBC_00687]
MRSLWNGAISFGLVSIPIKLMNATESHSISFRQIHLDDGGRIRYRKVCELEDTEVESSEIGKAYEEADGTLIPITDEDLAALPLPTARTIEIVAFVPADRIDPLQMDTAYYLSANGVPATKPYVLLREALKRSKKVAVAKFALRGRERLGMLRVVDDVIAMHGLLWPDEIRATDDVAPDDGVTVRDKELDLADALMDTLGGVDLDTLHDDYREAVEELITAKAEGHEAPAAPAEKDGGKVLDLMAALEKSVSAAKQSRGADGEGDGDAEVHPLPAGRSGSRRSARTAPKEVAGKKSTSTAKKTTAKKTTAKTAAKTATKKIPARKSTTKTTSKTAAKTSTGSSAKSSGSSTGSRTAAKKTAAAKKTSAKKTTAARKKASA